MDGVEYHALRAAAVCRAVAGEAPEEESRRGFAAQFPALRWDEPFRLVTVAVDREGQENVMDRLSQSLILQVENILAEVLAEEAALCPLDAGSVLLVWHGNDAEALLRLQSAYARTEEYIKRYLDCTVTAVISDVFSTLSDLPQAYRQNMETLSFRYLLDHGRLHSYHPLPADKALPPPIELSELETALRLGDPERISAVCAAAFYQMGKRRGYPLRKLRVSLLDMLFALKRSYPAISSWQDAGGRTLESLVQTFTRLGEVREAFLSALDACVIPEAELPSRPEIAKIVRYVRNHPAEDMTVSKAAKLTQLSESYFAHIFKREMGLSFIDWLNRERVERARRMLRDTHLRVNEIAAQVGIENANYFSILFKKLTGKTPMEERDEAKKQICDSDS